MGLEIVENTAVFDAICAAEDAGELADWLAEREMAHIDLSRCTHIHAAVFQTLLAFPTTIVGQPVDPFLTQWILPQIPQMGDE